MTSTWAGFKRGSSKDFAWFARDLRRNGLLREAGGSSFLVYGVLLTYANSQGYCYPSTETIARDSGLSEKTIRKALNTLESLKMIRRNIRQGTSSAYYILPISPNLGAVKKDANPRKKVPPKKKPEEKGNRIGGKASKLPLGAAKTSSNQTEKSHSFPDGGVAAHPYVASGVINIELDGQQGHVEHTKRLLSIQFGGRAALDELIEEGGTYVDTNGVRYVVNRIGWFAISFKALTDTIIRGRNGERDMVTQEWRNRLAALLDQRTPPRFRRQVVVEQTG